MSRYHIQMAALSILTILAALMSLSYGRTDIPMVDILGAIFSSGDDTINIIVRELRLPRVILGILVGASLGLSGAALQGVLRNPLADPGVIGVTASASLGAVLAIHLGLASLWPMFVPVLAMTGAMITTAFLLYVSNRDTSVLTLILIGIGISSLAVAIISLIMNMSATPMSIRDMIMWMLGSLENRTTTDVILALPFILLGWVAVMGTGQGLNALSVGEESAATMGINIKQLKMRVVIGSALSVGAAVAVCGSIGFVGLVVPHMVRGLISQEPSRILLPSAILGALVITLADILTRLPTPGTPLRLGVVTALIGAPAFIYIILKTRDSMR